MNELTLILIGTGLALGMNWLMPSYRKKIREDVKTAEQGMKRVLTEMAYLEERKSSGDVWVDLDDLEEVLHDGLRHAHEQVDNTLGEEDYYYADYLEMRLQQCSMLQTLRNSVMRIPDTKAGSLCSQVSGVFVRMFCGERFSGRTALETGRSARSDESGSIAENQGGI